MFLTFNIKNNDINIVPNSAGSTQSITLDFGKVVKGDKGDTGDICEQEVIKIDYEARPREFYEQDIIPAMGRTLERCLNDLQRGIKRRVPQVGKYATFDKRI